MKKKNSTSFIFKTSIVELINCGVNRLCQFVHKSGKVIICRRFAILVYEEKTVMEPLFTQEINYGPCKLFQRTLLHIKL